VSPLLAEGGKQMITDQQRIERDPVALQLEILEIEKIINNLIPSHKETMRAKSDAEFQYKVIATEIDLQKSRLSSLQSVLRSLK
jgi:hypothetical protein